LLGLPETNRSNWCSEVVRISRGKVNITKHQLPIYVNFQTLI
jgi:hypothetical protein